MPFSLLVRRSPEGDSKEVVDLRLQKIAVLPMAVGWDFSPSEKFSHFRQTREDRECARKHARALHVAIKFLRRRS